MHPTVTRTRLSVETPTSGLWILLRRRRRAAEWSNAWIRLLFNRVPTLQLDGGTSYASKLNQKSTLR